MLSPCSPLRGVQALTRALISSATTAFITLRLQVGVSLPSKPFITLRLQAGFLLSSILPEVLMLARPTQA